MCWSRLACRELGDEDTAALELDGARTTFGELGARADLARVEALVGADAQPTHGLTERELEVLRLVAAGHEQPADRRDARAQRAHGGPPRAEHPRQAARLDPHCGGSVRLRARPRLTARAWSDFDHDGVRQVGRSARCAPRPRRLPSSSTQSEEDEMSTVERYETVIVGGGQAGLAAGYHLARRRAVVRDPRRVRARRRRVAQPLELAAAVHPGEVRRPTRAGAYPRRVRSVPDEGRDGRLPRGLRGSGSGCPCETACASTRLSREGDAVRPLGRRPPVRSGPRRRRDRCLPKRRARPLAGRSSIRGSCSSTRATTAAPSSCAEGGVLVVGAGNSGAEIAFELAARARLCSGPRRR